MSCCTLAFLLCLSLHTALADEFDLDTGNCGVFGDTAHDYIASLIDGSATERPPARRLDRW